MADLLDLKVRRGTFHDRRIIIEAVEGGSLEAMVELSFKIHSLYLELN